MSQDGADLPNNEAESSLQPSSLVLKTGFWHKESANLIISMYYNKCSTPH